MSSTGFKRIGLASAAPTGTGMLIPRSGFGNGGEYGADITDNLRTFAMTREPVGYRVVFTVAHDIFDNWFRLEGSNYRVKTVGDASENGQSAFDRRIQKLLTKINAKTELTRMAVFERGYGWAILVLGYSDAADNLSQPVAESNELLEVKAYAPTQIVKVNEVTDKTDARYGMPQTYEIARQGSVGNMTVHYTRVIHFATRLIDHDYKGKSVLDPVWDDLTVLRNIRWGMGQTMYRYGSGFPDITFTGAELSDIDDFIDSGSFSNLNARTYFVHSEDQTMEFKGLQGHALDPMNYYLPPMEHISCGTGIPLAILRGVQAGALTGSQTDVGNYAGLISDEQSGYEQGIRELIYALIGQETDFIFRWNSIIEEDETAKQAIALQRAQELDYLWNFYTRNEIRKMHDPDAADLSPEDGGDDLKNKVNSPQPKIEVNPLTGQPQNNPLESKQIQEQINQGDASYVVTEVHKPRPRSAGSS